MPCSNLRHHWDCCPWLADDIMAGSCSLLLRTFKPEIVSMVVDKQNVWPCPFGVLPLWTRLAPSLKNGDQRNHLCGFHSVNLGNYQSWRPRVRADAHRCGCNHWRLVGRLEGSNCGLIALWKVMVDGFLSCVSVKVRQNPVNQQPHGTQGKPKRHFPSTQHVLEI